MLLAALLLVLHTTAAGAAPAWPPLLCSARPGGCLLQPPTDGKPPALDDQGLVGIAYSDPSTGIYIGSPSILPLPNGSLLASHDTFVTAGPPLRRPATYVYQSDDGGGSWRAVGLAPRQYWSTLFLAQGAVYLLGTTDSSGAASVAISMSEDGGANWKHSELMQPPPGCTYATGSVPVLRARGRLWRAMELMCGEMRWPQDYHALLISASLDPPGVDLLDPAAWQASDSQQFSRALIPPWMPSPVSSGGFLEGNVLQAPGGGIALLLRCRVYDDAGRLYGVQQACLYRLTEPAAGSGREGALAHAGAANSNSGRGGVSFTPDNPTARTGHGGGGRALQATPLSAGPASSSLRGEGAASSNYGGGGLGRLQWAGFVDMPGGGNKFNVRWDPGTNLYLALTNPSIDRYGANPDARNILTLVYSRDLLLWRIATTVLVPNDGLPWDDSLWRTAYQYADWHFDGSDLVAAIRVAWDGAHNYHDANWLAFKRIKDYRQYLPPAGLLGADGSTA